MIHVTPSGVYSSCTSALRKRPITPEIKRVPNPCRVGGETAGPPCSHHCSHSLGSFSEPPAVPRFHFHHRTPAGLIIDPDGSELPDLEAAHTEAITAARHLWAEAIVAGRDLTDEHFEIADGDGSTLSSLPFREALPPSLLDQLVVEAK